MTRYYLALKDDGPFDDEYNITEFWLLRQQRMPALFSALQVVLLYHPTSASAERVFSLVRAYTGDRQVGHVS